MIVYLDIKFNPVTKDKAIIAMVIPDSENAPYFIAVPEDSENKELRLNAIRVVMKGGKGSGNWAHRGRPGKVGGSSKGTGGLSKLGADKKTSYEERVKFAEEWRNNRDAAKVAIKVKAEQYGYEPELIRFEGKGYDFDVAGTRYRAAGDYNPRTREIRLYESGMTPDFLAVHDGVLTHEIMHDKFNTFMKHADKQHEEIMARLHDERERDIHWRDSFMRADGTMRSEEDTERYKAALFRDEISGMGWSNLAEKGKLVSNYAKSYWEKFDKSRKTEDFYLALNETLAETARTYFTGTYEQLTSLPEDIRTIYHYVRDVVDVLGEAV